ncbi:MAG: 2-hydroxyacyl-CoA dehydratase [Bradymonadales bacterium]|nr:2-hydroxyacyl-CoA dehydratase [Bradymonadales bacterium]
MLRRVRYELAGRVAFPLLNALSSWQRQLKRRGRKPRANPFGPPLDCVRKLRELMTAHYYVGRYAQGAVPVAWVTSGFPIEPLRALGFHIVYPENHSALCSAQHAAIDLLQAAEQEGFSGDLCSYARIDLGSALTGITPVGRLPRPDLLACCTNICRTVSYWYKNLASHFDVPVVMVDTPFVYGEAEPHHLSYIEEQLGELIEVAERIAGRRIDPERLERTMRAAWEGLVLWGECLQAGKAVPAPWTAIDGFFHMAPIVTLRGSEQCNSYYRMLRDELSDRVTRGIGGIKEERHRLLWDNLPIWHKLRKLSTLFAERGFNFVVATYTNAWAEAADLIDPAKPLESSAKAYTYVILNRDLEHRLASLKQLAQEYRADGAVLHSNRSCKPYSIGQVDLRSRLAQDLELRVLLLEADHSDPRLYTDEQIDNRIQAFLESFS